MEVLFEIMRQIDPTFAQYEREGQKLMEAMKKLEEERNALFAPEE